MNAAIKFVSEHFVWVDIAEPTLDKILAVHDHNVIHNGVTGCVIDPWNECTHSYGGKSETEYISTCLSVFREWARLRRIALWIVAHPAKIMRNKDGSYPVPGLWDIHGSATWRAKCDIGIICHRTNLEDHGLDVHIQKVRFKSSGKPGVVPFRFDPRSNRMWPA
jgi:twinkle protein